jgi:hypothetical protein
MGNIVHLRLLAGSRGSRLVENAGLAVRRYSEVQRVDDQFIVPEAWNSSGALL